MNLRQFVKETIVEIIEGVADAQRELTRNCVNPIRHMRTGEETLLIQGYHIGQNKQPVQNVEFDVAVAASQGTGTKGGLGVFVAGFGVGTQGQTEKGTSELSRIRFKVPISFKSDSTEETE